jgi:hypothetical protein
MSDIRRNVMKVSEILREASYEGNIGMMEIAKFYMKASPHQKAHFKKLVAAKMNKAAWDLVYGVIRGEHLKDTPGVTD